MRETVYVIGNYALHAHQILDRIGIGRENRVGLREYNPQEGEFPIMISTHGMFHGDSLIFTKRLQAAGMPINQKTSIDAHNDFKERTIGISENMVREIAKKIMFTEPEEVPEDLKRDARDLLSHMRIAYEECPLQGMALLGLEDDLQGYTATDYFRDKRGRGWDERTFQFIQGRALEGVRKVRHPRYPSERWDMHLSVDTDTIGYAGFIPWYWRNRGFESPSLDDVCDAIDLLAEQNNLRALDICGYSPGYHCQEPWNEKQGAESYRKIIETAQRAVKEADSQEQ